MAAPVIESFSQLINETSSTNLVLVKPAGLASGELLVAVLHGVANISSAPPDGTWTEVFDVIRGSSQAMGVYWKVAGGSEPSSYTFTQSASKKGLAHLLRVSGAGASPVITKASAQLDNDSTTHRTPSVTTPSANNLLLSIIQGYGATNSWLNPFVPPAGAALVAQGTTEGGATTDNDERGAIASETIAAAGPTGTRTWSWTSSFSFGHAIAIAPAAGGGGTSHALLADDIASGAPTVSAPSLGQKHALNANGAATAAPSVGTPALKQVHALLANDVSAGAPSTGSPVLGVIRNLLANDVAAGTPSVGSPAVGQKHSLAANDVATGIPSVTSPAVGQKHALDATNVATGNPSVSTPAIGQRHVLAAVDVAAGTPSLSAPVLAEVPTGVDALLAEDVSAGTPTVSAPALGQRHVLGATGIGSGAPFMSRPRIDGANDNPRSTTGFMSNMGMMMNRRA